MKTNMTVKQVVDQLVPAAASPNRAVTVDPLALRTLINEWGRLDKIVSQYNSDDYVKHLKEMDPKERKRLLECNFKSRIGDES